MNIRHTLGGLALAATLTTASAQLYLDEPFSYADGGITNVSSLTWSNHSGASPLNIASGKAVINQAQAEDVSRGIPGAPITGGFLYVSCVVNFSTLPTGSGAYFLHFKDGTTSNFRGKIFAATTGAATGKFRLGVANALNTPVFVPDDLSLNTDYTLVMRYEVSTDTNTVLWVNPVSENSFNGRADATDAPTVIPVVAIAMRQAANEGVLNLDDLKVGVTFADVYAGGNTATNPPGISDIPSQYIAANASTTNINFTVQDGETPSASLNLVAQSSNPTLVPLSGIVLGGLDANRTVTVTPAAGRQGTANVTITVTDGDGNTAQRVFAVNVGSPTISPIANQLTKKDATLTGVAITVGDAEDPVGALTLSATSSDATLLPPGSITFGGSGANRTLSITPAAGQAGLANVTVTVSDSHSTRSTMFVLTVQNYEGVILDETFTYPDSLLADSGLWIRHSGTSNDLWVVGGKLSINATNFDDLHAFLQGASVPYTTNGGWVLYARMKVSVTRLPASGTGEYFAHFNDSQTGGQFRGRVYAVTNGAAVGKFRFATANGTTGATAIYPFDCSTNATYTVIVRHNVGLGQATLWVDPVSEDSPGATATDIAPPQTVQTFSFRQTTGEGFLTVDDLKIGTAFTDVAETRYFISINRTGLNTLQVSWPLAAADAGYVLQSKTAIGDAWATNPDQGTTVGSRKVVTITSPAGSQFFQLVK